MMTARTGAPMPPAADAGNQRHVYGPRAVGALVAPITRPAFKRRSPAAAGLAADWAAIVGPALAAVTLPRAVQGGTLTIVCAGPVAMELQHLSPQLIARVNDSVGHALVQRLRLVQTAAPAVQAPARPAPSPAVAAEAAARTADLPEGPLRDALSALGRAVLARDARKP
jgi:hypothetical protein